MSASDGLCPALELNSDSASRPSSHWRTRRLPIGVTVKSSTPNNEPLSEPPRKVSKQCFNLFPKMREVDEQMTPALQERVFARLFEAAEIHDIRASGQGAERKAIAGSLAPGDQVRRQAKARIGTRKARTEAADHLIQDEQEIGRAHV